MNTSIEICEQPVFVVGAPRSGTSMLQWALRQHPQLWGGQESDYLVPLIERLKAAHQLGSRRGDLHWLSGQGVSLAEFLQHAGYGVNALYTNRSGGRRWVEQTPQYTLHLEDLATMFPGAAFLLMVRDGRDVVTSMRHFVQPVEHREACQRWRAFTEAGLAFADSPRGARLYQVSYRRIVDDTDAALRATFDFLGLQHAPQSVEFIRSNDPINSSFAAAGKPIQRRRWTQWTADERAVFDEVAGDLLLRLGFEPDRRWVRMVPVR